MTHFKQKTQRAFAYVIMSLIALGGLSLQTLPQEAVATPQVVSTAAPYVGPKFTPAMKMDIKTEQYSIIHEAERQAKYAAAASAEVFAFDIMAKCGVDGCADELAAERKRQAAAAAARANRSGRRGGGPARYGSGACGGDLPPCSVMKCESGGNLNARNGQHTGKWQFARGTWGNYKGYPEASDAPEEVQDEKAKQYWDGGKGRSHWEQCL